MEEMEGGREEKEGEKMSDSADFHRALMEGDFETASLLAEKCGGVVEVPFGEPVIAWVTRSEFYQGIYAISGRSGTA